jgi:hypothetical protein
MVDRKSFWLYSLRTVVASKNNSFDTNILYRWDQSRGHGKELSWGIKFDFEIAPFDISWDFELHFQYHFTDLFHWVLDQAEANIAEEIIMTNTTTIL